MDLPPGSVIVVGPNGTFRFEQDSEGWSLLLRRCLFCEPGYFGAEQDALVDKAWATRTETGDRIEDQPADLPAPIAGILAQARPEPVRSGDIRADLKRVRAVVSSARRPWWRFWG
ncbi:hypothetical protein [Oceaniglobus trochenteri]|uniref:hypothetical protein n=1 Tax=Oceaniglobus trochenteri TaxID=2763260 RepID=UPI001CFF6BFC|nr:hypothetical protein [Oceaniglobus trochenteri]